MKKILILLGIILFVMFSLLASYGQKNDNITFAGQVDSLNDSSIVVTTSEAVGFDLASVSIGQADYNFTLEVGQKVMIEILPEVRESYPAQVTAVSLQLVGEADDLNQTADYQKITAAEAKNIMDNETVLILDVRTQSEYDEGHIEQAILLPYNQIEKSADELLPDQKAKILVYCRSGNRSYNAVQSLLELGYTNVFDFGGIIEWPYEIIK